MPSCFGCWSNFFRNFDLFPNSKLLRYNGEAEYTSTTGGIISVGVIIIFIVLFASMGLRTIQRDIIFASIENQSDIDPPELTVTMGPNGGDFMLSVFVFGVPLTTIPRLFDVKASLQYYGPNYVQINSTNIALQQCSPAHFNFNSDLSKLDQRLPLTDGLCMPIGQKISLVGKATSSLYSHLSINVTRCNSTIDPTCLNDTIYSGIEAQVGKFILAVPFINSNINPGSQNYRNFYLEDENSFYMNSQLGSVSFAYISQDIINTDVSIMPYEQIQGENVTRIQNSFTASHFLTNANSNLAQIFIRKSPTTTTYERSFNKIDAYFSYVGGLVGTIIGLIFIMDFYTQKAYEISLARKVLLDNDRNQISSSSFNIFYYFSMVIKGALNFIKCKPNWPKIQLYEDCCSEIGMQIDITYIIRKLMFFDEAIAKIMEYHQISTLYLRKKPTLEEAKEQRRKHFSLELFREMKRAKGGDVGGGGGGSEEPKGGQGGLKGLAVNISKQQLVFEEEGDRTKPPEQHVSQIQDISAIQFSEKDSDFGNMKQAIEHVAKDNKKGRARSRKILEVLDPSARIYTGDSFVSSGRTNLLTISPIKKQKHKQKDKLEPQPKKKEQQDFQYIEYNFDKDPNS